MRLRNDLKTQTWPVLAAIAVVSIAAGASNSGVTYQGRILKPDGTPLSGQYTQFRLQLRTPDSQNCLMYEEIQSLDLRNTNGAFSLTMNDGTGSRTDTTSFSLDKVFGNRGSLTFDPSTCSVGPGTYSPNPADGRSLVVLFKDENMSAWEPMPSQKINFVPFAFEAKQISGVTIQSLVRVAEADGTLDSVSPLSNANYTELLNLLSGTSTQYAKQSTAAGTVVATAGGSGNVPSPSTGSVWLDTTAGSLKYYDGTSVKTLGSSGGGVTSVGSGTGLTGGPITSTGTLSLASLGSGGTGFKVTYDSYGRVTAAVALSEADIPTLSTAGKVVGSAIASGTIGGTTSINTSGTISSGAITSTGLITSPNLSSTAIGTQSVQVFETTNSFKVTIQASPSLGANYTLTLPTTAGASNQVLTTNGSGVLSWTTPAGTGISALTGDVTASGTGSVAATVASVGGSSAANVNTATTLANAATNLNTNSAIVKRDASGNFSSTNATLSKVILNDSQATPSTVSLQAPSTVTTSYVLKMPAALPGTSGYILATDTAGNLSWIAPSSGSVTGVTGTAPIVSSGGATPAISIAKATTSVDGYLAAADFMTFNSKLGSSLSSAHIFVGNGSSAATDVAVSGDIAITNAGAVTVNGVKGKSVSATPTTAGQVLRYDGTNWTPNYVSMADLRSTVTGASSATTCTAGQTLTYTSVADNLACTTIALADTQITYASQAANKFLASPNGSAGAPTYRAITTADLPVTGTGAAFVNGGNTFGTASTIGNTGASDLNVITNSLNRMTITSAGNVGIGTTAPAYKVDVVGDVNVSGVFRVNGTAIGGGSGTVTSVTSANTDIAVASGTTTPALTLNSGTGANQIVKLTAASKYPAVDGSLITNINLAGGVGTTVLPVANGGTNSSTALNNNRLMASISGSITELAAMTDGQMVVGKTGSAPQLVSMSGDTTVSNTGAVTVSKINGTAVSGVGLANSNLLQNTSGASILGNNVLVSNSAGSGVSALTSPTSGVLTSSGMVPSWSSTLATSMGGTGLTGFTTGDLLYASSTTALSKLAATTSGYVLTSNGAGTAPTWQAAQAAGGALSAITAATAGNTIDSLNFAQSWNWSTASTQSPLSLTANALTTGSLLNLTSSNASLNSTNGLLNVANTGSSTSGMIARIQSNSTSGSGLYVMASGNVGIGTISPYLPLDILNPATNSTVQLQLERTSTSGSESGIYMTESSLADSKIYHPANSDDLRIWGESNGDLLTIKQSGYIGIGTVNPTSPLMVSGNTLLSSTTNSIVPLTVQSPGENYSTGPSASGAYVPAGTMQILQTNVINSSPAALSYYQTNNTNGVQGAYIGATVTAAASANVGADLVFGRRMSASVWAESMRIDKSGNVGIGTTAPAAKLDVTGSVKLGTNGVAVSAMGACSAGTFTAASGANARTCTGIPTGTAVNCSPSASQGATVMYVARASAADQVTINLSAAGVSAAWYCSWVQP